MSRRGSTGPGRPATLPATTYTPPPMVQPGQDHPLRVAFHGEDGRQKTYPIGDLPLPGWHRALAEALTARVGPAGTARTLASAQTCWDSLQRFVRFLAGLPGPPTEPGDLLTGHVERFIASRRTTMAEAGLTIELRALAATLRQPPLADLIRPEALAYLTRRRANNHGPGKPGYSDGELTELLAAARADVAALRSRMEAGEALLAAGKAPTLDPGVALDPTWFADMAATGAVPRDPRPGRQMMRMRQRRRWAGHLFLTLPDITSLMVLLVAVTGRNVESIKELPAEHRIVDERAVELRLTKRRRGPRRWQETVTWEIGPPHRALHTPGGLYLLVHRLAARGREFSGASSVWSVWRNGDYIDKSGPDEHHDPFREGLHRLSPYPRDWAATHSRGQAHAPPGAGAAPPVDFIRLKTSIDIRRTRQMGGHLPSAARSNTYPVLFTSYLRNDPTTIDWAREVLDDALVDAEQSALDAHRRALAATGGHTTLTTRADTDSPAPPGDDSDTGDTGWSRCADPTHHPVTGGACHASLLDCFHCSNATITPDHLPRLLDLLDALQQRQGQLPEIEWWSRYGPAWAAIRHDVLPKFSPAELDHAATERSGEALLDLVENPWEHP